MIVFIALAAGFIAGISPCIVPVLPVIFFAGAVGPLDSQGNPVKVAASWRRPVATVAGLALSFSLLVLFGAEILSLFHLPPTLLRDLGIAMLIIVGVGFLSPQWGELIERPFARLAARQPSGSSGGFVIGLALGLVFVPCAGPVLAAITVLGATNHVGLAVVAVTVAFAIGVSVPLLFIALAGDRLATRNAALRRRAPLMRRVGGAVMILMALGIGFNTFASLQRLVPGYTSALQSAVEGSQAVRTQLGTLSGGSHALTSCPAQSARLVTCSAAPDFTDISAWLNTPHGEPLTLAKLRGHVVLIDFWTYSCINCQRSLPHVEAWYARYHAAGLDIVGVHTPEFSFEHVVANVQSAAASLGVHYPIAVDDSYGTWNAYSNEYWPAEYLIDAHGIIRHVDFGEGGYGQTESLIRTLLTAANPGVKLPAPTSVPNLTPTEATSPETYLGYSQAQYQVTSQVPPHDSPSRYSLPRNLAEFDFGLGGSWTQHADELTAGSNSTLALSFVARDVYLVMGGSGVVSVDVPGRRSQTFSVGSFPKLYALLKSPTLATGVMTLHLSPGVEAYDFTFG